MTDPAAKSEEGFRILPSCSSFTGPEHEYEDGTNIVAGTPFQEQRGSRTLPWYIPADAKGTRNWKDNLLRLRNRFDKIIDEFCPAECEFFQWIIPASDEEVVKGYDRVSRPNLICATGGLSREPVRLFSPDWTPLAGVFAIKNVQGDPMLERDGTPIAYRFGFNRFYSVSAFPDHLRSAPVPHLLELMKEGGNLLYELPANIACSLWRNWLSGFSQRNNQGHSLWLDALFEISWQRQRGSPHYTERWGRVENCSVGLIGNGLFPRLPDIMLTTPGEVIPHQNGYPMGHYGKIVDVARSSVSAIDEILERESVPASQADCSAAQRKQELQGKRSSDDVFISYSHLDKRFLNDLLTHLKPIERSRGFSCWSDKQIASGSKWFEEIQQALSRAKVAVLLVSPNFLASNFIYEHEFIPLLERAKEKGVTILWIPVRASSYKETPISHFQAVISPDKPLAEMKAERDKAWVKICEEIRKALAESCE